jgi:hypothetical protein
MKSFALTLLLVIVPALAFAADFVPGHYVADGSCLYVLTQEGAGIGVEIQALTTGCKNHPKLVYQPADTSGIYRWDSGETGFLAHSERFLQVVSGDRVRFSTSEKMLKKDQAPARLIDTVIRQETVAGLDHPIDGHYAGGTRECVYQLKSSGDRLELTVVGCRQAGEVYTFTSVGNGIFRSVSGQRQLLPVTKEVYLRALSGTELAMARTRAGVIHLPSLRGTRHLPIYFLERQ